jgi:hypothetical protein
MYVHVYYICFTEPRTPVFYYIRVCHANAMLPAAIMLRRYVMYIGYIMLGFCKGCCGEVVLEGYIM